MESCVLNIFFPDFTKLKQQGFLKGYVIKISNKILGIYIYDYFPGKVNTQKCCKNWSFLNETCELFGEIYDKNYNTTLSQLPPECMNNNYVRLEIENMKIALKELRIKGEKINISSTITNTVIMFYNYEAFLKSEAFFNYETNLITTNTATEYAINQFDLLKDIVQHDNNICAKCARLEKSTDCEKSPLSEGTYNLFTSLRKYSNLFSQIYTSIQFITWLVSSIWSDRKISVKTGNLITAILVDLISGLLILHWINQWSCSPVSELFDLIELIVDNLRKLLSWLMGSPAGLKLNHAFNNMFGKFFLYHIDLWWMFLVISKSMLELILQIFQFLGMLGITFQAAILADLLSLASFHVYCIYTYAARLYNIQISGLIALWRLFLGRKHNPLRGGVDSCHYDHRQLFIGMLAFTIMLFLLPTTALYYIVFTTFRVIIIFLGGLLTRIQYIVQSVPLYLLFLWTIKSPRIAGNIHISVIQEVDNNSSPVLLSVKLRTASLFHLVRAYQPTPIIRPESIKWGQLISSLWRGKLVYPV